MDFCFEKGIPHSEFLKWDPEDRAKVLAFAMERAARCYSCGTAPWEWEQNEFAYTPTEEFCKGCYQKAAFTDTESNSLPGTHVKLVPTTPVLQAKLEVTSRRFANMEME